jgi:hypothetical protein
LFLGFEEVGEKLAEGLQSEVFEGEGGPVVEFEEGEVIVYGYEGSDIWMGEGLDALGGDILDGFEGDLFPGEEGDDVSGEFLVIEGFEFLPLFLGEGRNLLWYEESSVGCEAAEDDVGEGGIGVCSSGA